MTCSPPSRCGAAPSITQKRRTPNSSLRFHGHLGMRLSRPCCRASRLASWTYICNFVHLTSCLAPGLSSPPHSRRRLGPAPTKLRRRPAFSADDSLQRPCKFSPHMLAAQLPSTWDRVTPLRSRVDSAFGRASRRAPSATAHCALVGPAPSSELLNIRPPHPLRHSRLDRRQTLALRRRFGESLGLEAGMDGKGREEGGARLYKGYA